MRRTSKEAFESIRDDGTLGERQRLALDLIRKHGPTTGNEPSSQAGLPGLWKRCSELARVGLIREVGERSCKITGRKATLWEAVEQLHQGDLFGGVA